MECKGLHINPEKLDEGVTAKYQTGKFMVVSFSKFYSQ